MKLRTVSTLLLLLACQAGAASAQMPCKDPAIPPRSKAETVAPEMHVQGVMMSVKEVRAPLSVDEILDFYRALWSQLATPTRPGSMENQIDGWQVISTVQGDCYTTVQVKADGRGSQALVAVSHKPAGVRLSTAGMDIPMLPGSKILGDYGYVDGPRKARTVVVTNQALLSTNVDYYLSTLKQRGWTIMMQRQPKTSDGSSSHVLLMKKRP